MAGKITSDFRCKTITQKMFINRQGTTDVKSCTYNNQNLRKKWLHAEIQHNILLMVFLIYLYSLTFYFKLYNTTAAVKSDFNTGKIFYIKLL